LLFLYATSSLSVYGIIGAGWSSNSKYAFLGSLRSAAQLISYEVSLGLLLLPIALCAGSFNLIEIVNQQKNSIWYIVPLLPIGIIFFISVLAETNRSPFDLPEAEAEIVAGYNIEYSSMAFALFFLAEYSNMLWLSVIISICFFGGWLSPIPLFFNDSYL
jgi:NADH-quinone oxidoreductase subunit H